MTALITQLISHPFEEGLNFVRTPLQHSGEKAQSNCWQTLAQRLHFEHAGFFQYAVLGPAADGDFECALVDVCESGFGDVAGPFLWGVQVAAGF